MEEFRILGKLHAKIHTSAINKVYTFLLININSQSLFTGDLLHMYLKNFLNLTENGSTLCDFCYKCYPI